MASGLTPDLMSAETLAPFLDVSVYQVLDWARDGVIPCIRISHKVIRFDKQAVIEALRMKAGPR